MGLVGCIGLNGHIGHKGLIGLRGLGSLVGHTDLIGPIGLIGLIGQNGLVGFIGLKLIELVGLVGHISLAHNGLVGFIGLGLVGFIGLGLGSLVRLISHIIGLVGLNGFSLVSLCSPSDIMGLISLGLVRLNGHISLVGLGCFSGWLACARKKMWYSDNNDALHDPFAAAILAAGAKTHVVAIKLTSATNFTKVAIWFYCDALLVLLSFVCEGELVVTCFLP